MKLLFTVLPEIERFAKPSDINGMLSFRNLAYGPVYTAHSLLYELRFAKALFREAMIPAYIILDGFI